MKILKWLEKKFPVLFSKKFWGLVATATLVFVRAKGWFDEITLNYLITIFGGATTIGVGDSLARKIGKK